VYHDDNANCFRAYGNENWEFGADGLVALSHRKHQITRSPKHTDWPLGRRPDEHPGLSDLGLQEIPRDNVQSFAATPSKQYPATLSNAASVHRGERPGQSLLRRLSNGDNCDQPYPCRTVKVLRDIPAS